MKFSSLFMIGLFVLSSKASATEVQDDSCKTNGAPIALVEIYTAEKAYFAEFETYSDSVDDLGLPGYSDCDLENWSFSIATSENGASFQSVATSRHSQEQWSIDQNKEIK